MLWIACKMLFGDKVKYLSLICAIAFTTFLMEHQVSIFIGVMRRTANLVHELSVAPIWVMSGDTPNVDETVSLPDHALYRIKSIDGVAWAVPLFKGLMHARTHRGMSRMTIIIGVDDATLAASPIHVLVGSLEELRRPHTVVLDELGYSFFFPEQPLRVGKEIEVNKQVMEVVAIARVAPSFQMLPVAFTRYSEIANLSNHSSEALTFVLAQPKQGYSHNEIVQRINNQTSWQALTESQFAWKTISYYLRYTGIPINFGITIMIAIIVGTVVTAETFYLFTNENLRHFATMKAIGVTHRQLTAMVITQSLIVGAIGFCIGSGGCSLLFELTKEQPQLRGFILFWQLFCAVGVIIFTIVIGAGLMSLKRILRLEPAMLFRS